MKRCRAWCGGGSLPSSTGGIIQSPSSLLVACDALKLSSAQNSGSQRSLSARGQAGQVGGVDDQDGVELEADRPRLDAAHAGQEHGAEQLLVAGAPADLRGDRFEQLLARRVLDEADERLDVGAELHDVRSGLDLRGGDGRQAVEEGEVAEAGGGAGLQGPVHEISPGEGRGTCESSCRRPAARRRPASGAAWDACASDRR